MTLFPPYLAAARHAFFIRSLQTSPASTTADSHLVSKLSRRYSSVVPDPQSDCRLTRAQAAETNGPVAKQDSRVQQSRYQLRVASHCLLSSNKRLLFLHCHEECTQFAVGGSPREASVSLFQFLPFSLLPIRALSDGRGTDDERGLQQERYDGKEQEGMQGGHTTREQVQAEGQGWYEGQVELQGGQPEQYHGQEQEGTQGWPLDENQEQGELQGGKFNEQGYRQDLSGEQKQETLLGGQEELHENQEQVQREVEQGEHDRQGGEINLQEPGQVSNQDGGGRMFPRKLYGIEKGLPPKVVAEFTEATSLTKLTFADINKLFNLSQEDQARYFPEGLPRCLVKEFEASKGHGLLLREQVLRLISHVHSLVESTSFYEQGSFDAIGGTRNDEATETSDNVVGVDGTHESSSEPASLNLVGVDGTHESSSKPASLNLVGVDGTQESSSEPANLDEKGEASSAPTSVDITQESLSEPANLDEEVEASSAPVSVDRTQELSSEPASLNLIGVDGTQQSSSEPANLDEKGEALSAPTSVDITQESSSEPANLDEEVVEASSPPVSVDRTQESSSEPAGLNLVGVDGTQESSNEPANLDEKGEASSAPANVDETSEMGNKPSTIDETGEIRSERTDLSHNERKRQQRLHRSLNYADLGLRKHIVLDGLPGCGKSVTLAMLVLWARMKGWLVFYVPSGREWTEGGYYYKNKLTGLWDTPRQAISVLENMLKSHDSILNSIPCRIFDPITLGEGPGIGMLPGPQTVPVQNGSTLKDLVQFGIQTPHAAVGVVVRIRKELSLVVEVPVLLAIDEFNSWFTFSKYHESRSEFSRHPIHAKELSMVQAYRDMICENPVIVAAFSHSTAVGKLPKHLPGVPRDGKVFVDRYDFHEASIMVKHYRSEMKAKLKTGKRMRRMLYVLTNGNGNELRNIAMFRRGL